MSATAHLQDGHREMPDQSTGTQVAVDARTRAEQAGLAQKVRNLTPSQTVREAPDTILAALARAYTGDALWEALVELRFSESLRHYTFVVNEVQYVIRPDGRIHT